MEKTFDYVIVGAGSSGCVMANRLSENGKNSVLILEAGGKDKNMFIHMPSGYSQIVPTKNVLSIMVLKLNQKKRLIIVPYIGRGVGAGEALPQSMQ